MANALKRMGTILDAIHKVNPNAKVVGFGYDTNLAISAALSFKRIFPPVLKQEERDEPNPLLQHRAHPHSRSVGDSDIARPLPSICSGRHRLQALIPMLLLASQIWIKMNQEILFRCTTM